MKGNGCGLIEYTYPARKKGKIILTKSKSYVYGAPSWFAPMGSCSTPLPSTIFTLILSIGDNAQTTGYTFILAKRTEVRVVKDHTSAGRRNYWKWFKKLNKSR
jgi:hypothetical protein